MTLPDNQPPSSKRSAIPLLLALFALTAGLAILSFLTLGFAGVVVALGLCLALLIGLQYLIWGWWLTRYLSRRELRDQASKDGPRH